MKIAILTNFSQPYHTGGAEKVVQQIAESMVNEFGDRCVIYTQYGGKRISHNGVDVIPIGNLNDETFIKILLAEKFDHIFIYSDWYFKLYAILANISKFDCAFSIVPVGFNRMRSSLPHNQVVKSLFMQNIDKFKVVVHSENYKDAEFCIANNISYSVIPNGIDLTEFQTDAKSLLRSKYNLSDSNLILFVGNFFPGKGQEFFIKISQELLARQFSHQICVISTTVNFAFANKLRESFISDVQKMHLPIVNLFDIPRADVVDAFIDADLFCMTSQQEVSPLVLLESMAAKTPWVSMNVGNSVDLRGGVCIEADSDRDGKKIFDDVILQKYVDTIVNILGSEERINTMTQEGWQQIQNVYNWEKIKLQYKELFHGKNIGCNACVQC